MHEIGPAAQVAVMSPCLFMAQMQSLSVSAGLAPGAHMIARSGKGCRSAAGVTVIWQT